MMIKGQNRNILKIITTLVVWIPTVVFWALFVLGFKMLCWLNGSPGKWYWNKILAIHIWEDK